MAQWANVELNKKLFKNVDESMLTASMASMENCFITEASGLSKFPGLKEFADLGGNGEYHINKFGNDMICVGTDGRTFRIDFNGNIEQIMGAPVLGGERVSFARTRDGLMMAAGSQIIKFDGKKNQILSPDAPLSSFVGYIDGYILAVEIESGRFHYTALNNFNEWPALNINAVDGAPDDINAMLITPFNEIMFTGEESIEQFERFVGGDVPFFRRWSMSDGIIEPWTVCWADNATWGLNNRYEFVRLSGQTAQAVSGDIQKDIEASFSLLGRGDVYKAWAAPLYVKGQKFIIFQAPRANNAYGTKGFTALFDIQKGMWFEIFGWNDDIGAPDLWPGRSVFQMWGKTFVGGVGKVYELSDTEYSNDGRPQRAYVRTAHYDDLGTIRVDGVRFTLKRGVGSYEFDPKFMFRSNPDGKGWTNMQFRNLGNTGDEFMVIEFGAQGVADTFQFEWSVADNCPFEVRKFELNVQKVLR